MANVKNELSEIASQINKTPGFTCVNFRAKNLDTGFAYTIHQTPGDKRALNNVLTSLKQILGWTPEMYETAQEEDRQRRIALHAATVPALTFQEPAVPNGEAAYVEKTTSIGGNELPDSTAHTPTNEDAQEHTQAFATGVTRTLEYIDAVTAQKYFNMRLDTKAENHFGIRNRYYSSATVTAYAQAMLRGEWLANPQGLMFATDETGREWMIDGQQRMAGLIYADAEYRAKNNGRPLPPIGFYVDRNVSPEMFRVVDTGRKRTLSQTLQMIGAPNHTVAASVLRYVWLWFNEPDQRKWKAYPAFSTTQIEQVYREYSGIDDNTHKTGNAAAACGLSRAAMVASVYLIRYYAPDAEEEIEKFIEDFHKGANMVEDDPVLSTRNYAIRADRANSTRRKNPAEAMGFTDVMFHMLLIIRAWNGRVEGKRVSQVAWRADQAIPKPLPLRRR